MGVLSVLINQTSVVALGAAGPAGLAAADGLAEPSPGWPAGRLTSNWPVGVQPALKTVPESASRLSCAYRTFELLKDGGTTGATGALTVVNRTTTGVGATAGVG